MSRLCVLASLLLAMSCSKDASSDPSADLPVANSWNGQEGAQTASMAPPPDPHAGLNMGGAGDPHAGLDMGGAGDPHAGVDMGGAGDPHAGLDMGGAGGNPGGLAAPDPNRKIDPTMVLQGSLSASKDLAGLIKPGAIIFLSARPVNKVTGESLGAPLAVDRIDVQSLPVDFHLSGAQSMVAGTAFEGDVMLYARLDGDGEASSTLPGDIEGKVMATIPAEGLELVLDSLIKP